MPVTKINREVQKLKKITGSSEKTGWVKENVAHLLSGFVRYADVNLVVNIGHLWGKSALVFCDAMFNNRDFEDNWDPGDDPFSTHSRRNTNDSEIREVHSVDPLIQPLGHRPLHAHPEGTDFIKSCYPGFTFHNEKSDLFFLTFDFAPYKRKMIFIDGDPGLIMRSEVLKVTQNRWFSQSYNTGVQGFKGHRVSRHVGVYLKCIPRA